MTPQQVNRNVLHFAFAFDENYATHGSVAILSLLSNLRSQSKATVFIVDVGLSQSTRGLIKSFFETAEHKIDFLPVPSGFLAPFPTAHHAASAYARFALPQLLPDIDKVLYLDSDLVVVDDLEPLFHVALHGKPLAAVPDVIGHFKGDAVPYMQALGVLKLENYFNSGVMMLNLKAWREESLLEQLAAWCNQNPSLMKKSDQSALNALFWNSYERLNLRWNLQVPLVPPVKYGWGCTREQAAAVERPAVVHYITDRKPWRREFRVPLANLYWQARANLYFAASPERLTWSQKCHRFTEELSALKNEVRAKLRRMLGRVHSHTPD